jgi:hypothetical protein
MTDDFNSKPAQQTNNALSSSEQNEEVDSDAKNVTESTSQQQSRPSVSNPSTQNCDHRTEPTQTQAGTSHAHTPQGLKETSGQLNRQAAHSTSSNSELPEPPQPRHQTDPHSIMPTFDSDGNERSNGPDQDTFSAGNDSRRASTFDDHVYVTIGKSSFRASVSDAEEIRRAQRLTFIASTCGIFSLFFGGIILGTIGLITAIVGYRRLGRIGERYPHDPRIMQALKHNGRLSITVCGIALALNVVSLIILFPALMQAAEMGDYSQLLNGFDAGQGAGTGTGSVSGSGGSGSSAWG